MGGAMPSGDKQLPISVKKVALRELSNKGANIMNKSPGASPLAKDKEPAADSAKAVGAKRQQTDAPSSPGYHNVYVRRKVESEHSKLNSSQELKKNGSDKFIEQNGQQDVHQDQADKPKVVTPVAESGGQASPEPAEKPSTGTVPEQNEPQVVSGTPVQDDRQRSSNQYWSERSNRLQAYLENCDRSTQEGYMQMLRSLPAAERSKHAIELEKRAIRLLLEEGNELQRMKVLDVLGKVSPNNPATQTPLQPWCQK